MQENSDSGHSRGRGRWLTPPSNILRWPTPALLSTLARHKHHARDTLVVPETPSAASSLTEALNKLTESISAMQQQMASQAVINKAVDEKLAKLSSQISRDGNRDRDRSRIKHANGSGQRPAGPVCTYCNRVGHTAEECYKKQRAKRARGRLAAAGSSSPRPPSAYLAEGSETVTKGVRFESAFMAIAQNIPSDSKPPELPSMVEAKDLPLLTDIPGVESAFSDSLTPIRYLGLCSGASVHLIKSLVLRGRYLAELYLCDKDPIARNVALATLEQIAASYPTC